ncbi:hypothetical protein COJ07_17975 [Bacillus cereus]|uniref:hypothetical protein n=1 Tax=Bacillus cereus TaxID=1396 RepID=UPI000BF32BA1|nr:hypothetical protein [Bacillus cereus]PFL18952.1 hypothetical protein COJ07_17975 [Bacillus cereus]
MESRLNIRQYADKGENINETINRIAILAKKEVEDYHMRICDNNKYRTMIKAHYIPLIERLANNNWHRINNEIHFIDDCFRRIRYAIRTFDIDRGDFDKRVKYFIYRSLRDYCGRRGEKRDKLTLIDDTQVLETLGNCAESTENKAIYNVMVEEEIYTKLCEKETDVVVLNAMVHTAENYDKASEAEVSRVLSERADRSFDSARGAVRGFRNRLRKRNIRKEDVA